MSISNYAENKMLDSVFNGTATTYSGLPTADPYIALHTSDPGETGANEVTGGSYARQQAAFGAAASGTLENSANIDFANMPAVGAPGVVGWSAWDAVSAGNCLWTGWLSTVAVTIQVDDEDLATDDIESPTHGFATDDRVVFEALENFTVPTGLTPGTLYFVLAAGLVDDMFRVSTTSGGAAANITAEGQCIARKVLGKTVNSGDTFRIATGDLDIFLD